MTMSSPRFNRFREAYRHISNGIGKSRLPAELQRLAAEPHTRLRYFCSPQHTDSALYHWSNGTRCRVGARR
jgi:hypothetical protein